MVAVAVVVVAFGWWVVGQPSDTPASLFGVLAPGVLVVIAGSMAARRRGPVADGPDRSLSGVWIWAVLGAAVVVFQLSNLFAMPREDHPTISSMVNALDEPRVLRTLFFLGWLALGWWLTGPRRFGRAGTAGSTTARGSTS
jgi:hypothetical protein